jgi:hypothetical protein
MDVDYSAVFAALNQLATLLIPLLSLFGVVAGLFLIASASKELAYGKNHQGHHHEHGVHVSSIMLKMLIAACLLQFSTSVDWTATGLLAGTGGEVRSAMTLVVTNAPNPIWSAAMSASFLWLAALGLMAVFRGFIKWNAAASGDQQQGDAFWGGLWHIIGGAILFNIGSKG